MTDNTALFHALRENDRVIGVFVLDDAILRARDIGAARTAFLFGALQSLNADFEKAWRAADFALWVIAGAGAKNPGGGNGRNGAVL